MSNIIFKIQRYLKKHQQKISIAISAVTLFVFIFCGIPYTSNNTPKKLNTTENTQKLTIDETIESTTQEETLIKSNEEIADEVIKGLWGSGSERYNKLTEAGYNYCEIQKIVDHKLPIKTTTSTISQSNNTFTTESMLNVASIIWNLLKSNGYSNEVCAGILGNIQQECNFRWNVQSVSGIGICQWGGSRKVNLISRYGNNPTLENQVFFMMEELLAYQQIHTCTNVIEATDYFCYKFERPGIPVIEKRRSYANYWYNIFT